MRSSILLYSKKLKRCKHLFAKTCVFAFSFEKTSVFLENALRALSDKTFGIINCFHKDNRPKTKKRSVIYEPCKEFSDIFTV